MQTHTHAHTCTQQHCPATSFPLCLLHPLIFILHTPFVSTHTHTHRQMSCTLKLNGWPDGESLSFSNKDLSLLSLHPPLSLHLSLLLSLSFSLSGQYGCVIVVDTHTHSHIPIHKHKYFHIHINYCTRVHA